MNDRKLRRTVYPTAKQKRKLIEMITEHPELITGKVTQSFNYSDAQKLWQNIADECNSIPGARKTWKQWKKTWQDLRSKTKKKERMKSELSSSILVLTKAQQEALGLKRVSSTTSYQDSTEFISLDQQDVHETFNNEIESSASISSRTSPVEVKVFTETITEAEKLTSNHRVNPDHTNSCIFNCEQLALQEQTKLELKRDYFNFRKEYLREKLMLMKEQTEALKNIARDLSK